MKRKTTVVFLTVLMIVALFELATVIVTNFDDLSKIIFGMTSVSKNIAIQMIFGIAILLICWVALFVILLRQKNNSSLNYGKRDTLTDIGNRNFLESKYKKYSFELHDNLYFLYIGFEQELILQKFDDSSLEKIQKETARILSEKCGFNESVARIDEAGFAMIMSGESASRVQTRISEILSHLNSYESFVLNNVLAPFRCGFCCANKETAFENALKNSKIAYDHANKNNKESCFFIESMATESEAQNLLKQKFINAMNENEFLVYLQFVFDVKQNKFIGAEALARWNSIDEGFVMPVHFIKRLYSVNLIEEFDLYMLDKVCALLEKWSNDKDFCDLLLSCNITRVSISSRNFLENFKKILKKYNFNHEKLILEITEDALIDNQTVAYRNIISCREEGVRIALDDFGAGNSSFSDINNYPIDEIKIDRNFVSVSLSERSLLVLDGLIKMAHSLDIDVVCEGIETKSQNDAVIKLGTEYIQGHYYSLAYPIEEAKSHYKAPLAADNS